MSLENDTALVSGQEEKYENEILDDAAVVVSSNDQFYVEEPKIVQEPEMPYVSDNLPGLPLHELVHLFSIFIDRSIFDTIENAVDVYDALENARYYLDKMYDVLDRVDSALDLVEYIIE